MKSPIHWALTKTENEAFLESSQSCSSRTELAGFLIRSSICSLKFEHYFLEDDAQTLATIGEGEKEGAECLNEDVWDQRAHCFYARSKLLYPALWEREKLKCSHWPVDFLHSVLIFSLSSLNLPCLLLRELTEWYLATCPWPICRKSQHTDQQTRFWS